MMAGRSVEGKAGMQVMTPELQAANRNLAGVGLLLMGVVFLTSMDSTAKALVGADYSVMQILAIRGWLIVAALVLILPRIGGLSALKTKQPFKHLLRVSVGFAAPYFFFSSLKFMGLADATVIFFGGATFLMTALSVPVFKERVGPHRWGAVIVGFIGVVIAAQPGDGVFRIEALFPIASGMAYAVLSIATRSLGPAEGAFRPVFFFNLGLACIASVFLPMTFIAMPGEDMTMIAIMATLAVCGHFCITRAFQIAPLGLLAPFEYTSIICAAALGYLIWSDVPGTNILIGGGIIVSCGFYLLHRETLAARREKRKEAAILAVDPMVITARAPVDDNS